MKAIVFSALLLLVSFVGISQVKIDSQSQEINLNDHLSILPNDHSSTGIDSIIALQTWQELPAGTNVLGIGEKAEWLKIDVQNIENNPIKRYLYFSYSMVKEIDVYLVNDNRVIKHQALGSHRSQTNKDFDYRGFNVSLDFPENSNSTIYVRLNNNFRWLRFPLFLLDHPKLVNVNQQVEGLIWFWKGVSIFALLLTVLLFLKIRLKLFSYYFLANVGFLVFIASEIGDYFLFFDTDPADNIIAMNHIGSLSAVYFYTLFINELSGIFQVSRRAWQVLRILLLTAMVIVFATAIPGLRETEWLRVGTITLALVSFIASIYQVVTLTVVTIRKGKPMVFIYSVYMLYTLALYSNTLFPLLGLIKDTPVSFYSILYTSMFEIVAFLVLIANQALNIYKERSELLKKVQGHQKDLVAAIVQSQETERNMIGRELHDLIGANLSSLKQWLKPDEDRANSLLSDSIETVRNLSHGLTTPRVQQDQFMDEIHQLCADFSTDTMKVKPYIHGWKELDKEVSTHLFRICQELLQNAKKHSGASDVFLQLIRSKELCSLIYEDNGVGFKNRMNSRGIGMKNIENRSSLIDGELSIDSNDRGTTIIIEFQS